MQEVCSSWSSYEDYCDIDVSVNRCSNQSCVSEGDVKENGSDGGGGKS